METQNTVNNENISQEIVLIVEGKTGIKIDPQANFLEIGGNSIAAAQVIGEINQRYYTDIQVSKFLDSPNIGTFINDAVLEVMARKDSIPEVLENQGSAAGNKWPLTSDQERIWFLDRMNPSNPAFNIYTAVRVKGVFQMDILNESFQYLIKRHELLRAQFIFEDNRIYQLIQPAETVSIPFEEIKESEIEAKLKEEASKGMNISEGNLVRLKIYRLSDEDNILFLNIHHIISDAWSLGILMEDLMKIYVGKVSGQGIAIENLKSNYHDFIRFQENIIEKNKADQLNYWKETLKDVPTAISLPYDLERPQLLTYQAGSIRFELKKELVESVKKLSMELKVTQFNLLYSSFTALLYLASGQNEFLIGCPVANRKLPEFNKIIGFFTNTLVMKNQFSPGLDMTAFMKKNHDNSNSAFNHSDIPFMNIVQNIVHTREFNSNPLFQVMFSMLQMPADPVSGSHSFQYIDLFSGFSDYDIFLTMQVSPDTVKGSFAYSRDVFVEKTAQILVDGYLSVIEQVVKNPGLKMNELAVSKDLQELIELRKRRNHKQQVVISSTFSDQPLQDLVSFWTKKLRIPANIVLADYNQVFNQLLDPSQLMTANKDGVNVLLVRLEDWVRYSGDDSQNGEEKIVKICDDFIGALQSASGKFSVPLILSVLPARKNSGVISNETADLLTQKILDGVSQNSKIYVLKAEEILEWYPVQDIFDELTDKEGHLPFTADFYKALGTSVSRKIYAINKRPLKVIVLDCDNTLWKGVIAEDGIEKIEVDPARAEFQKFMAKQQESGVLLCLVSKNEEADVVKVFKEKPGMVLKLEQITVIKANWDLKSESIKKIAGELNLGLDSFVFIDDNPVECAEVKSAIPELLTLPFPQEPENIAHLIKHGWFWDQLKVTEEDAARTRMYQEELQRKNEIGKHMTFQEFFESLQLEIGIEEVKKEDIPRVSQLTQRTNQFNSTAIRLSEAEIDLYLSKPQNKCLTVRVSDRFGSYGLVGSIFFKLLDDADALRVESLILSCRTLGKGVEHKMMNYLADIAIENKMDTVIVQFAVSPKNTPVYHFLSGLETIRGKKLENGEDFYYSSGYLKNLKFNPAAQTEAISDKKAENKKPGRDRADQEVLLEIINSYHHINQINVKSPAFKDLKLSYVKPENKTQERIIALVREVLNIDQIGIDDNFFDLGGYSLQLVQLLSKIQKEFNRVVQITDLFQYTNIRKLADYLEKGDSSENLKAVKERGENQRRILMAMKK